MLQRTKAIGDVTNRKPMQRVGVLSELPDVLHVLGADPAAVFHGSGIAPHSLSPDLRLAFPDLLLILERAARISGCSYIGLLLGRRFELLRHHGVMGQLMHSAPTLKQAIVDFVTRQPGYSSGAIVYLNQFGDKYDFGYGTYAPSAPGARVLYDTVVSVGMRMVQELTNGTAKPASAHFSHGADQHRAIYSRLLNLPVQFNQPRSGLMLPEAAMRKAPLRADPAERQRLLAVIRDMNPRTAADLATRVSHSIRHQLHYEGPTMSAVARELGIHPRTLRRRLKDEGETFENLLDRVRYAVACELLGLTVIPISEVADVLGFASLAVFSRAFRRWSGTSPSSWRRGRTESWSVA
ncbi:AraC family transcriptional regulator [Paracoccus benzoatiresistens]|uniref:AraC family transcriptional regulator ligand-binding domain-containing protein n=1 Tax=Paracoccus benzoatiresistens TaxID=2997341 RepID=A0ABT4JB48_9RHOB|nr:AraC family transcriptional regulator [Paracoccus sp. EF6]MCZ0964321.1 AraC family transcriptional regulator ligand-binding domain-containing protein [Paracoccus sp. EF6]